MDGWMDTDWCLFRCLVFSSFSVLIFGFSYARKYPVPVRRTLCETRMKKKEFQLFEWFFPPPPFLLEQGNFLVSSVFVSSPFLLLLLGIGVQIFRVCFPLGD
ncbi:hypothetical protein QBC47DRAFT_379332 [Echria macrotheca]|uniref:Transmembrane protein n=1 Tax=Echria macrotheca TaxID=438768 RepID=A0AAJ0BDT5_9PEZI|nr:hypothetical protein QBC47DRAFT_379332 [Echria macrotheca]